MQPERTAVVVKAWSSTAGPYGVSWTLEIGADGAASVTRWRGPGKAGHERHYSIAQLVVTRQALVADRKYVVACERFRQATQKALTLMR